MKSNIYKFKELKGSKVHVVYDKEEFDGIFDDFDLDGKFVFIKVDGVLRVIRWTGANRFEMKFEDPQFDDEDETSPESLYNEFMDE